MAQDNRTSEEAKDSRSKKGAHASETKGFEERVAEMERALRDAQEKERRALADYQNLVRRTQKDRANLAKFATRELVSDLIQPLEHLRLASVQLQDKGLEMVVTQLWMALEQHGVKQTNPLGEEFDVQRMEAVDQQGEGNQVIEVRSCGYELNGQVLQHAKVVVGPKSNKN